MTDYNFLDRLLAGEDSESIAKDLAKQLNDAIAKADEMKKNEQKMKDFIAVVELSTEFVKKYYPDIEEDIPNPTDADYASLLELFESGIYSATKVKKCANQLTNKLEQFLSDNGLV